MISDERKEVLSLIMKIEFLSFFIISDILAIALFGLASIAGKNGMNGTMEALFALGLILMFVGIGGTAVSHIIGIMLEKKWKVHCFFCYE